MELSEYSKLDGLGLVELVKDGTLRRDEPSRLAAKAAQLLNPTLNAVVDVYEDRVAKVDDLRPSNSSFAGVPLLLKDIGAMEEGRPQWSGSALGLGFKGEQDSFLTRAFKDAGLNIIGRTNLPEFAQAATTENRHFGDTSNPWNTDCSAGGSSGGAGAAVAAGIVPIAHGTDTGGSIRIPAACCGVVGLKPSRGRISKGPQLDETLYGGLNTEFVLTRTVRDAAAMLDSTAGPATGDPFTLMSPDAKFASAGDGAVRPLRIALQVDSPFGPVASDVSGATERVARSLEADGHSIELASPPVDGEAWSKAEHTIWIQSTAWEIKRLSAATGNKVDETTLEPLSLRAFELARDLTADDWFEAKANCNRICREVGGFFSEFDVLITPTIARTAPKIGEIAGSDTSDYDNFIHRTGQFSPFTSLFNITGQPAISLPLAQDRNGMPIGVQLVAGYGNEFLLLQLAFYFEQAMPWAGRVPPVHVDMSFGREVASGSR